MKVIILLVLFLDYKVVRLSKIVLSLSDEEAFGFDPGGGIWPKGAFDRIWHFIWRGAFDRGGQKQGGGFWPAGAIDRTPGLFYQ